MRILVSGASGLIGSALVRNFEARSDEITRLVRKTGSIGGAQPMVLWDPVTGEVDGSLDGFDVVIHLAGETVAQRWTPESMARIRTSRVGPTSRLVKALCELERPPAVFACASAIGFYGDRGDELLTEDSSSGQGFVAELCRQWEESCAPAKEKMRLLNFRIGLVLSSQGGALGKMLPVFRAGLGGPLGSGKQYMSWIELNDLLSAAYFCLARTDISGPVNLVGPAPVTNAVFTETLAKVLNRPAILPVPTFGPRLLFGSMADELLFSSARVQPARLEAAGFNFECTTLEQGLKKALG